MDYSSASNLSPKLAYPPGKMNSATFTASHPSGLGFQAQVHSESDLILCITPWSSLSPHAVLNEKHMNLSQLSSLEDQRGLKPSPSRLKTSPKRVWWVQSKFHIVHLPSQLVQGSYPTSWIWQADTCRFSILTALVIFGIWLTSKGFLWEKEGGCYCFHLPLAFKFYLRGRWFHLQTRYASE